MSGGRDRQPRRVMVWLWALAVVAAAALLAVAVIGRDRGDGPTVRPLTASESMSDEQARAAAVSTVLAWIRERDAGHLANVKALSWLDVPGGAVALDVQALQDHRPLDPHRVIAFGRFEREGPLWSIYTHFADNGGVVFLLKVREGELRVDGIGRAPVP
ncbi:hypothetical protein [Mycobacteroides abscessus]|uniref:hypothetical protein n=1 Tax=Mycobacteroides abscessus TaxID=36809 RepID=UPI0013019798|nr:hypothetical protein [Mycobacteroides abscessus]